MKTDAVCFVGSKIETISLKKEVKVTTLYMTVKSWERRRYFLNEVIKSILTHMRGSLIERYLQLKSTF